MRKLFKVLSVIMVVALTFTSVGFANLKKVEAKSAVKSVKVKNAKKKLTLTVGDKKTFKVKVKAKKGKTKFKVKSSNKKVVKVKKKGKKITLTALKVGKAKVTVRSKTDKKKKYVIKVTVIAKQQAETTKAKETTKEVQPTTKEMESTTVAPTVEPTTEAPVTVEPTTEAPTVEPTTEAPTEAPTVEPTTEAPTVEPTTEAPTEGPTVEPTTEAPTVEPTTEAPSGETHYIDDNVFVPVGRALNLYGVDLESDGETAEIIDVDGLPETMSIEGIYFEDDDPYIAFGGSLNVSGSYEFTVTVLDEGDTWVYSITVQALNEYEVYGQVVDGDGNPIEDAMVYLDNDDFSYECHTDEDGAYSIDVCEGEYEIYAEYEDTESETQIVNVQDDTEVSLEIDYSNYHKVTITSNVIDPKYFGWWDDEYGDEYYGSVLDLEEGDHSLTTEGYALIDGALYSYEATVSFYLEDDMTVEATVSDIVEKQIESQPLVIGNQNVSEITEDGKWFKFTPTMTRQYRFWSKCTDEEDPNIKVYDDTFLLIGECDDIDDDNYNFDLTMKLEGQKTYYIYLMSWDGTLDPLNMSIQTPAS